MATASDLYKMTPERTTNELSYLVGCYYNHIPEVGNDIESVKYLISSDRVEIKFLKDWNFDFRRVWQLATVWFDGNPVMITQNAGREGDDHADRFITDLDAYLKMCDHIKCLLPIEVSDESTQDVLEMDSDLAELTSFYGDRLDGYFERY